MIEERFHNAIDWLYERSYYLAEQVSKLGYPELILGYPPTAGVAWVPEIKKIKFMFNAKFVKMITDEQFYFIVAHEAMHVINGHVFALKTEADKLIAKKEKKELQKYINKFGIAADCIVNDSLINLYNIPKVDLPKTTQEGKKFPGVILYGQDVVATDCHTLTIQNVIDMLPKKGESASNHGLWDSFFDKNGNIKESFTDAIRDLTEDCEENSALSDIDHDLLEDLKDSMIDSTDYYAKKAGKSLKSKHRKIDTLNAALNWGKILFNKTEKGKVVDSWSRPLRRLAYYPKVILPNEKEKEAEDLFVAIDVSSSIKRPVVDLFVSLIKNTPGKFKITAVTFNKKCTPFNLKSDEIACGGGTAFDIIEEYIQKNLKQYPKAVFVLTDGCGGFVDPEYPKRWCWLLYGMCSTAYCSKMTHHKLEDLIK